MPFLQQFSLDFINNKSLIPLVSNSTVKINDCFKTIFNPKN